MNYISPFSFFELPEGQVPDADFIALEKKKHLARLELSGKTFVTIGDKEYTKDALLNVFKELSLVSHWDYHFIIHKNPKLERFLAEGAWEGTPWRKDQEMQNENFQEFIRTWFVSSYLHFFKTIWKSSDFHAFNNFSAQYLPVSENSKAEMARKVSDFIHVEVQEIKNLCQDTIYLKHHLSTVRTFYNGRKTDILNRLPDSCLEARSNYFRQLCHLMCIIHDDLKDRKLFVTLIYAIEHAKCDPMTREEINRLYAFHQRGHSHTPKPRRSSSSSSSDSEGRMIAKIVFFIVIIVVNIFRCSRSSHSSLDNISSSSVQLVDVDAGYAKGMDYDEYRNALLLPDSILQTFNVPPPLFNNIFDYYLSEKKNKKRACSESFNLSDSVNIVNAFRKVLGDSYRNDERGNSHEVVVGNGSDLQYIAFVLYGGGSGSVAYIEPGTSAAINIKDDIAAIYFYSGHDLCKQSTGKGVKASFRELPRFMMPDKIKRYLEKPFLINFNRQVLRQDDPLKPGKAKVSILQDMRFEFTINNYYSDNKEPGKDSSLAVSSTISCKVFGEAMFQSLTR